MRKLHWRPVTRETLEGFHQISEQIMKDRGGRVFEDSTEVIRQMRQERTRELMGESEDVL